MASVLARQAARSVCLVRPATRAFQSTPQALKKKSTNTIDDLFGDDSGELFSSPSTKGNADGRQATKPPVSSSSSTKSLYGDTPSRKPSPEQRLQRYDELFAFVQDRIGKRPKVPHPPMRFSVWSQLFQLASTSEQLERIAGCFSQWKDTGHELSPQQVQDFVRRCEQLKCPKLALKVFGDYSSYSVQLNLPAARQLLHSLHAEHSLSDVMTAASLFPVYNLPSVSEDLVCCALVVDACMRDGSVEALQVGDALLGSLQNLVGKGSGNATFAVSPHPREKAKDKPRVWVIRALEKIDRKQSKRPEGRLPWLEEWRRRNKLLKSTIF